MNPSVSLIFFQDHRRLDRRLLDPPSHRQHRQELQFHLDKRTLSQVRLRVCRLQTWHAMVAGDFPLGLKTPGKQQCSVDRGAMVSRTDLWRKRVPTAGSHRLCGPLLGSCWSRRIFFAGSSCRKPDAVRFDQMR